MNIENIVIIAVVIVAVGISAMYIYKSKKKGQKCIGCPYSNSCNGSCSNNTENN